MNYSTTELILLVQRKEETLSLASRNLKEEASQMAKFLQDLLTDLRNAIMEKGFQNEIEEITFFKDIKPYILGKLIYYNKVYQIEVGCPVSNGKMYYSYFSDRLQELKNDFIEHISRSDLYRYYRSGRVDRDEIYFRLGNIYYNDVRESFVFEIDTGFSTYYDYKVAVILANEFLYEYLNSKKKQQLSAAKILQNKEVMKDIAWTNSKNALIELIYALYASGTISNKKIGIRQIALLFQILFQIPLGDIHHAFHRMKTRSNSRTCFLDHLKFSLEEYMDKDI
ncbi:RteC domain-containing protein [Sphingobacterium siyangense]|uniref:RteC protein n=1 Tax=Sphingobacterium siyangense TaxID=459529 RepID=A0A562MKE1_9SPHI|nr:RteC domain-containing protein [Sphingobacterium siyangense]TWI20363.1 RteC protein [Sphingobacterium siyangense]